MKQVLLSIVVVLLTGCVTSSARKVEATRIESNYRPYLTTSGSARECIIPRMEGYPDKTLSEVANDLWSRGYLVIGVSEVQGHYGDYSNDALKRARDLRACVVQYGAFNTHTINETEL